MGNIAIFTDSLLVLQALNSADPYQMIQGLHSSLAKLISQSSISLQWVPAHVGLTGNETADRLSKIGSQALQTQNPVTYREAKTLLHSQYNGDWKKENSGYQAHFDPIWRLERAQQTTIFHLHTGHCGLSAHLKKIGISDTSLCECRQATERRQLTWPQGADLATKLWGSAEDLYWIARFVASTGLKIWPAQLSIAGERRRSSLSARSVSLWRVAILTRLRISSMNRRCCSTSLIWEQLQEVIKSWQQRRIATQHPYFEGEEGRYCICILQMLPGNFFIAPHRSVSLGMYNSRWRSWFINLSAFQ